MMIQLLTSFTGSLGFCLVFHLRRRYLLPASLGSVLTCAVYMAASRGMDGILLPTLIAAAFAALYAASQEAPSLPHTEPTVTILPECCLTIIRETSLQA